MQKYVEQLFILKFKKNICYLSYKNMEGATPTPPTLKMVRQRYHVRCIKYPYQPWNMKIRIFVTIFDSFCKKIVTHFVTHSV